MEKITFCTSCGEANSFKAARCESCDAPLRKVRDWKAILREIPRPTPLSLLVAGAVIALGVALWTYVVTRP